MDPDRMVFLIVGVAVVVVVGRLTIHSGRRYVASGSRANGSSRRGAASGANLVAVLFHLATLGVVALIAVLPLGGATAQRFLLRIGILLLILAAVYGITLALLSRRREQAMVAEFDAPPPQRVDSEITYGVPPEHRVPPRTESTPDQTRLR